MSTSIVTVTSIDVYFMLYNDPYYLSMRAGDENWSMLYRDSAVDSGFIGTAFNSKRLTSLSLQMNFIIAGNRDYYGGLLNQSGSATRPPYVVSTITQIDYYKHNGELLSLSYAYGHFTQPINIRGEIYSPPDIYKITLSIFRKYTRVLEFINRRITGAKKELDNG